MDLRTELCSTACKCDVNGNKEFLNGESSVTEEVKPLYSYSIQANHVLYVGGLQKTIQQREYTVAFDLASQSVEHIGDGTQS